MKLVRTTKEKRHSHIAGLSDSGEGSTSVHKGHSHTVAYREAQAEELDEVENVILEAVEGGWFIEPAEDGHTHIFEAIVTASETGKKKKDDAETAKDVRGLYKEAKEYEKDFRKKAEESERYYMGEQWKKADKDYLESRDRAALTINEIEPKIDLLSGYQRQNRSDIRFYPVEDGDSRVADILTHVVKNITEQNNFEYEETGVFTDEMITGRGLFNTYVSYDENILGDIKVEKFPWDECWFGPHDREDLADCEYLVKTKWLSFAKVKELWPEKKDDIDKETDIYTSTDDPHTTHVEGQYEKSDNSVSVPFDDDFVDIARKEYRVLECWKKVYKRAYVLVNVTESFYHNAEGWDDKDVKAVKTIPGFSAIPRVKTDMRITLTAGNTILNDGMDEYFDGMFSMVPVYAKKRKKEVWGRVEAAKEPQMEINKRHSQSVDILNKAAAYGWFYDDTIFPSAADRDSFKNNCTSPGFLAKVANIKHLPHQVEGVKFPNEIVALESLATEKLREIMNINPELQGVNSRAESGIAIAEKKRQGLIGNEFLFDNLSLSKKILGRLIVKLVQKIYSPERILRLLENRSNREQMEIGGQDFSEYTKEEILDLLKESDLTKYDVAVGESAYNPTTRHANFAIWAELSKTHPDTIPLDMLIDLSDLPEKDKIKKKIEERMQAQAEDAERTRQTEIEKTLIARSGQMQ